MTTKTKKYNVNQKNSVNFLLEYATQKTNEDLQMAERYIWEQAQQYLESLSSKLNIHNNRCKEYKRKERREK
tara:strand:+ start:573 stop:788 length:216 start_codon:yes stop_codon:yes gene_type:complete